MAKQPKKLGELLVEWGAVTQKDVLRALEHAKKQNLRVGEALIDLKLCPDSAVYKALATQHNMEFIDLDKSSIPPNAVNLIPDDLMRKYLILPLGAEGGRLRVAVLRGGGHDIDSGVKLLLDAVALGLAVDDARFCQVILTRAESCKRDCLLVIVEGMD